VRASCSICSCEGAACFTVIAAASSLTFFTAVWRGFATAVTSLSILLALGVVVLAALAAFAGFGISVTVSFLVAVLRGLTVAFFCFTVSAIGISFQKVAAGIPVTDFNLSKFDFLTQGGPLDVTQR
jgi:hypothetical protein